MDTNFIPHEKTITIPWWMDCYIEGLKNPYRKNFKILDKSFMDAVVSGIGITRIDPADFYKEHLSKDES